ncbi:hypothetical protein [Amycolatopsis thailandensis]|uniref:hypothetical protein n=1 Tax=Amycolatopsis thailandensis TaxID=589330 RepID=UPI003643A0F8
MYDVTGVRGEGEVLAVSCGSRRAAEVVAEQAEAEGWREVRVVEQDTELAWRCGVKDALRGQFPAELAKEVERADAFGAVVYRVREFAREHDLAPFEVLAAISPEDKEFTGRADDPAAFLASKVRDLPDPTDDELQAERGRTRQDISA